MAKYIDADKALKQIKELQETDPATVGKKQFAEGFFCGLDEAEVILMRTSTTDVVEVPCRCGECKYWKCKRKGILDECVGNCYNTDFPFSSALRPITKESDYCSYGERKE